jgi:hypothetical protein
MKTMVESDDMTRRNLTNQVNRNILLQQSKSCKVVSKGKIKPGKYAIGESVFCKLEIGSTKWT